MSEPPNLSFYDLQYDSVTTANTLWLSYGLMEKVRKNGSSRRRKWQAICCYSTRVKM